MSALPSTDTIAVIGAGTMGAGIAQVAAAAGHPVLLFDAQQGAAEKGRARVAKGLEGLVAKGKLSAEARDGLIGRIRPVEAVTELAPARLAIEAIVERLDIKQEVFRELEEICGPDVILVTNTSSISVTAIGAGLMRPERLVGMHFFNPAPIMKLVEVISGLATDPKVAQTVFDTAAGWGKHAVHARSTPGFIVNRVARPFYGEALRLLQEGAADHATLDTVMREAGGFRMGPFELMDLIGHDVNSAVTRSVFEAYFNDPRYQPSLIQQELVAAGRLGRKSGRGFYDYGEGAEQPQAKTMAAVPKPEHSASVEGHLGVAEPLVGLLEAAGMPLLRCPGRGLLRMNRSVIALTDGRSATQRAAEEGVPDLVVFDLALDYAKAPRIVLAAADQASPAALEAAVGLFQALGKAVTVVEDVPGLVVMRTVAMLANEGADAVNQGVCDVAAVDVAMQSGVNYPRGPLGWADAIGPGTVLEVLDNLARTYGEDRYRASPLLRRYVHGGRRFHG
jgi:3-hydroxybutyryl-CoA dehydrogenase